MKPRRRPRFDLTPEQARSEQERLARAAARVERFVASPAPPLLVAGADVAYDAGVAFASVVVMRVPGFEVIDQAYAQRPAASPTSRGSCPTARGPRCSMPSRACAAPT